MHETAWVFLVSHLMDAIPPALRRVKINHYIQELSSLVIKGYTLRCATFLLLD